MPEQFHLWLELAQFALTFAVVPLIGVLWKLSSSVNRLEVILYKEFVTKEDYERDQDLAKWRQSTKASSAANV